MAMVKRKQGRSTSIHRFPPAAKAMRPTVPQHSAIVRKARRQGISPHQLHKSLSPLGFKVSRKGHRVYKGSTKVTMPERKRLPGGRMSLSTLEFYKTVHPRHW